MPSPDTADALSRRLSNATARALDPADEHEETVMFTEETPRTDGDGTADADGWVLLVVDPVTGDADCFGPYAERSEAQERALWRQFEFDVADLADVIIGVVPWHAEGR